MSWGSKQTTTSTNTGNNAYNNTTTPMQSQAVQGIQNQVLGQIPGLIQSANAPVYGQAQQAGFLNNLNDLANNASKHLSSTLAGQGGLLSGANEAGQLGIQQQKLGSESSFFSQLPFQEQQAHLQNLSSALGVGSQLANAIPYATNQQGYGSNSSSGQTVTSSNPGLSGLVGGLAGIAGGAALGGLGSMVGGGSFSSGFGGALTGMGGGGYGGGGYGGGYGGYGGFNAAQNSNGGYMGGGSFNGAGGQLFNGGASQYTFPGQH